MNLFTNTLLTPQEAGIHERANLRAFAVWTNSARVRGARYRLHRLVTSAYEGRIQSAICQAEQQRALEVQDVPTKGAR